METREVPLDQELLLRAKSGDVLSKLMVFDAVFGCECGDCGGGTCNQYPIPILDVTKPEQAKTIQDYIEIKQGE